MSRRRGLRADQGSLEVLCACGTPTRDAAAICEACLDDLSAALRSLLPSSTGRLDPLAPRPVLVAVTPAGEREVVGCAWPRVLGTVERPGLWAELTATVVGEQGVDYRTVGGGPSGGSVETGLRLHEAAVTAADELARVLRALVVLCRHHRVTSAAPDDWRPRSAQMVPAMAEWLQWRLDGLAFVPEAAGYPALVRAAVGAATRLVDRPGTRQQLGLCTALDCMRPADPETGAAAVWGPGRLTAHPDSTTAVCEVCGARYDADELRNLALWDLSDQPLTATEIAHTWTYLRDTATSHRRVAARVRQWAARDRITPVRWVCAEGETYTARYHLPDVVELLAADPATNPTADHTADQPTQNGA